MQRERDKAGLNGEYIWKFIRDQCQNSEPKRNNLLSFATSNIAHAHNTRSIVTFRQSSGQPEHDIFISFQNNFRNRSISTSLLRCSNFCSNPWNYRTQLSLEHWKLYTFFKTEANQNVFIHHLNIIKRYADSNQLWSFILFCFSIEIIELNYTRIINNTMFQFAT